MQDKQVSGGTFWTFWTCATWTDHGKLKYEMDAIGLGEAVPARMTDGAALYESLKVVFPGNGKGSAKDVLIRPLSELKGYAVVEEEKAKTKNEYKQLLMARIDNNQILLHPFDQEQASLIVQEFGKHKSCVGGSEVGSMLVRLAHKYQATTLRQTGGIYALPMKWSDIWRKLSHAVESSSSSGRSIVYLATMEVNADSVRVVRDAIRREMATESKKLLDKIASGTMGDQATESAKIRLIDMEKKVQEYEAIVGESLSDLRDALNSCAVGVGMAAFQSGLPEVA